MFSRDLIGKIQRQHFFVEKHMLPRSKPVAAPKRGLPSSSGAIRQPILHSDGSHPTRSAGDAGAGHSQRLASSPPSRPQLSCQTPSLGWLGSRFAWSKALHVYIRERTLVLWTHVRHDTLTPVSLSEQRWDSFILDFERRGSLTAQFTASIGLSGTFCWDRPLQNNIPTYHLHSRPDQTSSSHGSLHQHVFPPRRRNYA